MRAESFDERRARCERQKLIGDALAETAFARGDRLTEAERGAVAHSIRWGSDGYPVRKLGPRWTIEHPAMRTAPIYVTKRAAVANWEIMIDKWLRMSALERGTLGQ